jgi:hypothetical protein
MRWSLLMYPLNVTLAPPLIGFAVANDAAEHAALNAYGYVPLLEILTSTRADLIAQADAQGIKVDGRWSDARLLAEIEKAV